MSSIRCLEAFAVLVCVVAAGCAGSPVDRANRLLDDVLARYVELSEQLAAEDTEYTEGFRASGGCMDMDVPQWSDPASRIPAGSRDQAQAITDQLSSVRAGCGEHLTAAFTVVTSVRGSAVAVDLGQIAVLVAQIRAVLTVVDPERLGEVLDAAPTRFSQFEAVLVLLDPTAVLRADGGVMARNFDEYSDVRAERSAVVEASFDAIREAHDAFDELQRDWEALQP